MEIILSKGRVADVKVILREEDSSIHVLDKNLPGTVSVTNSIKEIQAPILKRCEENPELICKWDWFLYHTDGTTSMYNGGFNFVPVDDPRLEPRLVESLLER